jgi:hypothetical protein
LGHWTLEKMAKGVPAGQLFQWWTDFSSEDPEILKKRGVNNLASRQATREGNTVHVENDTIAPMGRHIKFVFDAYLHPESLSFETKGGVPGMVQETTHYTFTEVPGVGTKISVEQSYTPLRTSFKILDALGIAKRMARRTVNQHANALIAEAQEKLSGAPISTNQSQSTS